jgi:hypothetical protein
MTDGENGVSGGIKLTDDRKTKKTPVSVPLIDHKSHIN